MNYKNYQEVREKAASIRAIYGHRYDLGQISVHTFDKVLEITSDMKNNPNKFTK